MTKKAFIDQMGKRVLISFPPKRIISLVPSQTELLFSLGLEKEVVGLTKFCIHPSEKVMEKTKVGGTKKYHFDRIRALKPDLIIGNKEENERTQIEELSKEFPVWMSDIETYEDALEMIKKIGELTNKLSESINLIKKIKANFESLTKELPTDNQDLTTAYFIWRKPYLVAANQTFINEMLKKAGLKNIFENQNRYPEITLEELLTIQPKIILLSSEPYPFAEKHIMEFKEICPTAVIKLVDGELFSWYGNRLLHAPAYFAKLRKEIKHF